MVEEQKVSKRLNYLCVILFLYPFCYSLHSMSWKYSLISRGRVTSFCWFFDAGTHLKECARIILLQSIQTAVRISLVHFLIIDSLIFFFFWFSLPPQYVYPLPCWLVWVQEAGGLSNQTWGALFTTMNSAKSGPREACPVCGPTNSLEACPFC